MIRLFRPSVLRHRSDTWCLVQGVLPLSSPPTAGEGQEDKEELGGETRLTDVRKQQPGAGAQLSPWRGQARCAEAMFV